MPPNRNFDSKGNFLPGRVGFNLADVSSVAQINSLPDGVKALVWVGQAREPTLSSSRRGGSVGHSSRSHSARLSDLRRRRLDGRRWGKIRPAQRRPDERDPGALGPARSGAGIRFRIQLGIAAKRHGARKLAESAGDIAASQQGGCPVKTIAVDGRYPNWVPRNAAVLGFFCW